MRRECDVCGKDGGHHDTTRHLMQKRVDELEAALAYVAERDGAPLDAIKKIAARLAAAERVVAAVRRAMASGYTGSVRAGRDYEEGADLEGERRPFVMFTDEEDRVRTALTTHDRRGEEGGR